MFLLYLYLIGPLIILYKPWDLRRRFWALKLKIHDAWGTYFFTQETERTLAMRRGDCNRCGACCQFLYRCPYLREDSDGYKCGVYLTRSEQCATFPHNKKSLDLLAKMGAECSYVFQAEAASAPRLVEMLSKKD